MIKVKYQKIDNQINNIKISGHAMFDSLGKDIVCAAASSIVISSINGILAIDKEAIEYLHKDNLLIINQKHDLITNKLLINMIKMLEELSIDYPKNIQIREEEK